MYFLPDRDDFFKPDFFYICGTANKKTRDINNRYNDYIYDFYFYLIC